MSELEESNDNPNERYESISLGTWSSKDPVNTFFNRFNHDNNYKDGDTKLSLGNYVTIQDGTYNVSWEIVGFDMEYKQDAADGTVYNNGYGICMIPKDIATNDKWDRTNNTLTTYISYKSSTMHNTVLPTIVNKLKNVLGSHIVNRNVLLSSSVDSSGNYYSGAYTWTTAYATLMSIGQMTGTFASNRNKYDDGEANYKLPLFNYESYVTGSNFWTRGVCGYIGGSCCAWYVYSGNGGVYHTNINAMNGVRPLIYLR